KERLVDKSRLKRSPVGRPSLFDAPRCRDLDILDADLAVLGVPFSVPYDLLRSSRGSTAPQTIREQSMRFTPRYQSHYDFDFGGDLLAGRRVEIVDCGDVATSPATIPENPSRITAVVRKILERGAVPVVLGGEHSIPIPVMRAFEGYGPIHIVHVDAHLDWRDEINGIKDGPRSPPRPAPPMPPLPAPTPIRLPP